MISNDYQPNCYGPAGVSLHQYFRVLTISSIFQGLRSISCSNEIGENMLIRACKNGHAESPLSPLETVEFKTLRKGMFLQYHNLGYNFEDHLYFLHQYLGQLYLDCFSPS